MKFMNRPLNNGDSAPRSYILVQIFSFFENYTVQHRYSQHLRTLTPINTRTQTLPYEHLRRTEPANLEIHKVTIGASLSMGTSPTTESIEPLNPRINPENASTRAKSRT
jgi:hypothetical protein